MCVNIILCMSRFDEVPSRDTLRQDAISSYLLPPPIIICTVGVRTCVHAFVRECVTQFSPKLLQLHIFGLLLSG